MSSALEEEEEEPESQSALVDSSFASAANNLSQLGGTVVPAFDLLVGGVSTDATGASSIASTWPAAAFPGFALYLQAGVIDPGAPFGLALTNAVVGVTQP